MLQPGRTFGTLGRYGFNGKENDNEVKGVGDQQDYGMRIYDPRVGRFLSVDPLISKYAWYSSYQFAGNNPIIFVDLDGAEPQIPLINKYKYGHNVALNSITVVDNTAINLVNGGIGLVNSFVSVGHEVVFNTKNVPRQFKDASIDLYHSTTKYTADSYKNLTETSFKQQLKEAGKALTNPETYENTLTLGVSLYAGKGVNIDVAAADIAEENIAKDILTEPKNEANIITTGRVHGVELHWGEILSKVKSLSNTGEFSDIYVNKSINNALGVKIPEVGNWRPDILSIGKNKLINLVEVVSPSQTEAQMVSKLSAMREALQKAGYKVETEVINPQYKPK